MARMTAAAQPPEERHGRAQSASAQAPAASKGSGTAKPGTQFDDAMCLARQAGPGPRM